MTDDLRTRNQTTSPGLLSTSVPSGDENERCRVLRRTAQRGKLTSWTDQLQFLPDGGLVRSQRLARLEAALLIAGGAVPVRRLIQLARLVDGREVRQLVQVLNDSYDRDRTAFRIELTAAGYIMMTRSQLAPWLGRLHQRQEQLRLSAPAMETLTIIAYQQPVTRADIEAIRGVQSAEMIRQLIDRGLVRVGGEDQSLGRPFLYETTRQFLAMFRLQQLDDLPGYATLRRQDAVLSSHTEDDDAEESTAGEDDENEDDGGEDPGGVSANPTLSGPQGLNAA